MPRALSNDLFETYRRLYQEFAAFQTQTQSQASNLLIESVLYDFRFYRPSLFLLSFYTPATSAHLGETHTHDVFIGCDGSEQMSTTALPRLWGQLITDRL